ncbi:MAG: hypothetical protein ABIH86_06460 [Planctomycetota bacterium]
MTNSPRRSRRTHRTGSEKSIEEKGIDMGLVGGILMMLGAVIWFVVGWMGGIIFFYPPILFIMGLYGALKGLLTGNIAGKKTNRRPARRSVSGESRRSSVDGQKVFEDDVRQFSNETRTRR